MWTEKELYDELNYVNHSREKRLHYANLMLSHPELLQPLIAILFQVDDTTSCRAAWVLEFVCGKRLEALLPHLDQFTNNIHHIHLDPAVRPVAKICEHLVTAYYGTEPNKIKETLSAQHKESIIEACFDWMINDEKVAPKAYSMQSLYLLGQEYKWIHPELRLILEKDFQSQSAAFKARARHILRKLKS